MSDGKTYCSRCNWPTNKCRCTEKELKEFTLNMKVGAPIAMTTEPTETPEKQEAQTPWTDREEIISDISSILEPMVRSKYASRLERLVHQMAAALKECGSTIVTVREVIVDKKNVSVLFNGESVTHTKCCDLTMQIARDALSAYAQLKRDMEGGQR